MESIWKTQKAFGDDAVSAGQLKLGPKCLRDGGVSVGSDPHSGRPAISRTPEDVDWEWATISKDQRRVQGPKMPTLKGTGCHCPMHKVSCILYLLQ